MWRAARESFADVLSLDDVDAIIASSVRRPAVRMIQGGRPLDPDRYCVQARLGGRRVDGTVDAHRVAGLLRDGATLVLQSLQRTWPPAARFADDFAGQAGHPVQLNAYLTPPAATGLAEHADDHDVFALQVLGRKHWSVNGLGDIDVGTGDVLYIPAGVRHCAATSDERSLHLTLGVFRRTYRSLVERMLRAASEPELDAPLPLGTGAYEALTAGVGAAIGRAVAVLRAADAPSVADGERSRCVPAYDRTGIVKAVMSADSIRSADLIAWAAPAPRATPLGDGRCRVAMGSVTWRVPEVVADAIVDLAAAGEARPVSSLSGLDPPSCVVVARRLLLASVCRVVDP